MKRKFISLLILLMACVACMAQTTESDTVTFTSGKDKGTQNGANSPDMISKDGITISCNEGAFATAEYHFYSRSLTTITSTVGKITKVLFTYDINNSNYTLTNFSIPKTNGIGTYKGTKKEGTWTGEATSFTLEAEGQVRASKIKVIYTPNSKNSPNLSFSSTEATATLGKTFTAPALENPNNLTVTYTSSNEGVATVDASTGAVTLVSTGTTTITATSTETDQYASGKASYTLLVRKDIGNNIFVETFDKNNNTGGNDGQWSGNIGLPTVNFDNEGWESTWGYSCDKCAQFGKTEAQGQAETPSITIPGNENAVLTFRAGAWDYSEENTTLTLSATNATLSETSVELTKGAFKEYSVNISNVKGNIKIKFTGVKKYGRFFLDDVVVSPVTTYTKNSLSGFAQSGSDYWATFSSNEVTFFPDNVANTVTANGGNLTINDEAFYKGTTSINGEEITGSYVPANTGVLIHATKTPVTYYTVSGKTIDNLADGTNMLHAATETMSNDNYYYYKLAYNDYNAKEGLGFYWGADEGAAFQAKEDGAYLAVAKNSGAKANFLLDGETTSLKAVVTTPNAKNAPAFNLAGQRVDANYKGIVIVGGKKILRR